MSTGNLSRMFRRADRLAAAIAKADATTEPGLKLATVRALVSRMTTDEACSVIGLRPKPPARDAGADGKPVRFDPTVLIG